MKNLKYEKPFMPGGWLCFVAQVADIFHAKLTMESQEIFNNMTKIISILTSEIQPNKVFVFLS